MKKVVANVTLAASVNAECLLERELHTLHTLHNSLFQHGLVVTIMYCLHCRERLHSLLRCQSDKFEGYVYVIFSLDHAGH